MYRTILPRLSKLSLLAAMAFSVVSCEEAFEDKGSPILILTPDTKTLTFDGTSSQAIKIETNRDWKAFLETPEEWLELSKTEGSGDGTIIVSAAAGAKQETAILTIALYNQVGIMLSEQVTITRNSDGTVEPSMTFDQIQFDGTELPTAYSENQTIEVDNANFVINVVANYSTAPDSTAPGPIQFKKEGSYIYNTTALCMSEIEITLSGTFNNFTVFAGTTEQPATEVKSDGTTPAAGAVVSYVLPEGSTYFIIKNTSTYASYANAITILPGTPPSVDDDTDVEETPVGDVSFIGKELPTSFESGKELTLNGVNLTVNNVADFSRTYKDVAPIQFKAGGDIFNTTAMELLDKISITLAEDCNNLVVYGGNEPEPTVRVFADRTLNLKAGDVVTYTFKKGEQYFRIANEKERAANLERIDVYNNERIPIN